MFISLSVCMNVCSLWCVSYTHVGYMKNGGTVVVVVCIVWLSPSSGLDDGVTAVSRSLLSVVDVLSCFMSQSTSSVSTSFMLCVPVSSHIGAGGGSSFRLLYQMLGMT